MRNLSSFLKSTVLFIVALLLFLSLLSYTSRDISFLSSPYPKTVSNLIGIAGAYLGFGLFFIFGYAAYFFPFCFFFLGLDKLGVLRFSGLGKRRLINISAFIFCVIFLSAFMGLFAKSDITIFDSAGVVGFFLAKFFKKYLGLHGAIITISLLITVNSILLFGLFFIDFFKGIKYFVLKFIDFIKRLIIQRQELAQYQSRGLQRAPRKDKAPDELKTLSDIKPEIKVYTPKVRNSISEQSVFAAAVNESSNSFQDTVTQPLDKNKIKKKIDAIENQPGKSFNPLTYILPDPELLKVPPFSNQQGTKDDIKDNIKRLEMALLNFDVKVKVVSVQKGPVVTSYELAPQAGTKIQKISVLSDDIALAMKSSQVRIVAPLPGRGTVGIEIPNEKKNFVFLREVLEEKKFINSASKLTLVIGKDVSGNPIVADLGDMPHLLIAGATGSGKTVCVNSLISSILFKARPDEVKFILIDPKMVELAPFAGIPHLIHPIISDPKKAFFALNWAVEEMEKRYRLLAAHGSRNIDLYVKAGNKMFYIVIVVDELADLMLVARDSIETAIQRLAQLSRAVGIHLVLATQRPSVDVITGIIKANFPSRISFKVATRVDSRTVLDMMGAEKLLGTGDLLFLKPGAVKLIRAQGSYIDDEDIEHLTNFVREQGKPMYEQAIAQSEKNKALDIGSDELFDEAVKIILRARQASGSILQRRLRVGYTRAARLLDIMEQKNIVGPFCGSKAREILVDPQGFLSEKGWL
ncbi:MAG: DNA translocase FtsK [Omnitrophica bacterium]|nr:DNA translocase FtsK [Candidatus Omnitrophota bacterium]